MGADPDSYSPLARALHWALAALILGLTGLGAWMVTLDYYDRLAAPALHWHRVFGLVALTLAVLSVAHRLGAGHPPPLPSWRRWEDLGARSVHGALLALMVVTPASGYLISTAAGHAIPIVTGWSVPALGTIPPRVRPDVELVHAVAAYAMLTLVGIHAAAAFKHHLIDRDATLIRMLLGRSKR